MAVQEQTPYIEHIANGVTTSFALEFECKDKEHLIVLVDNVEPNVGTWSLVNGAVVFGTAPADGKIISIQRNTPFRRDTNFQSYDNSLRPSTINNDLDWVWYKLQELGVANWILKQYVDRKDDELKAYLLEEIRKQGVALDQLDEYYDYLMGRLAQIAVDKGWDASFVVTASGKTQQEVNDEQKEVKDRVVYIQDFGGAYNDFDPSTAESEAKAIANPSSKPYDGARQFAFPMRTLKVWNYLDGFKDRGAVASFRNMPSFNATEPATQVLGISKASDLVSYPDRDVVGLFVQTEGQPTLLTSTNTTFTATTVTCLDFSDVASSIRKGQIIDVVSGATRWSSIVDSVQGNTVTIETGWYIVSGGGATGTPPNAAQIKLVPNTKVWGQNTNVLLHETSDATRIAGFEMGIFNNKSSGSGYGFDVISTGAYKVESGYQARGKLEIGFKSYGGETKYAFAAEGAEIGLNTSQTDIGAFLYKPIVGVKVQEPTDYSFLQTNSTGGLLTGINKNACWEGLRFRVDAVAIGQTIPNWTVVALVDASNSGESIDLPEHSSGKTVYVRNTNATNSVLAVGTMEGGAGGLNIPAKTTVQFVSDGAFWYPLSKYTA